MKTGTLYYSPLLACLAICLLLPGCSSFSSTAIDSETKASLLEAKQLRESGNAASAVELLRAAHNRFPHNTIILQQLGYTLVETKQYQEAVTVFDQLIGLEPTNPSGYNGKAVAFDHLGNHLAAQDIYKMALLLSPDSVAIHNNLAMSLILNKQPKLAIAQLEPLLATNSDNDVIRSNITRARALLAEQKKGKKISLKASSTIGFIENISTNTPEDREMLYDDATQ